MPKKPDWPAIKRLYRAGQLSICEIARRSTSDGRKVSHVAILKRAKREGWKRDLSDEVRAEIRRRLVTERVTEDGAAPEEIVDAAASQGVDVIRKHRRDIGSTAAIEAMLLEQLTEASRDVKDLEGLIREDTAPRESATKEEIENLQQRRSRLMKLIGLASRATVLKDLTQVQRHRIHLERQAFNLNDRDEVPDSIEERLRRIEEEDGR